MHHFYLQIQRIFSANAIKIQKNKQRDLRILKQILVSKANHWLLKNEAKPQFYSFFELKIKSHQNLVLLKLI